VMMRLSKTRSKKFTGLGDLNKEPAPESFRTSSQRKGKTQDKGRKSGTLIFSSKEMLRGREKRGDGPRIGLRRGCLRRKGQALIARKIPYTATARDRILREWVGKQVRKVPEKPLIKKKEKGSLKALEGRNESTRKLIYPLDGRGRGKNRKRRQRGEVSICLGIEPLRTGGQRLGRKKAALYVKPPLFLGGSCLHFESR